jgi:hypothetical protein
MGRRLEVLGAPLCRGPARGVAIADFKAPSFGESAGRRPWRINVNDSAGLQSNRFMADLTQAMRSTAEAARTTTVEQAQVDAKAYVEHLRAADESEALRKAAEEDVATIRERSKTRVERIRSETEQRIARRRELLDQELAEYNSAIELEVQSVQGRVEAFQSEVAQFFEQLLQGADPTVFASMASHMPEPPTFAELDRDALARELRARRQQTEPTETAPAEGVAQPAADSAPVAKEELPDHWWMDSPATLAARTQTGSNGKNGDGQHSASSSDDDGGLQDNSWLGRAGGPTPR